MEKTEEKVWGLYCPRKNSEYFDECPEQELFLVINEQGGYVWRLKHDWFDNRPWAAEWKEIETEQYFLEFLVYKTKRFGVEFNEEPSVNDHVLPTESYKKWFDFWEKHFESLTEEDCRAYMLARKNNEDISRFLPTRKWNDPVEEDNKPKR